MTKKELSEIKERESNATPGNWCWSKVVDSENKRVEGVSVHEYEDGGIICDMDNECTVDWEADAKFIAHSREDIPRLIEALEKAIEIIRSYDAEEDSVWELAADAGCILEKRTYKAREFLKEFDSNDNLGLD